MRAVLFDVDGVLVDATEWHLEALNFALKPFRLAVSPEQHEREFFGLPTAAKIEMLTERNLLRPEAGRRVLEAKRERFRTIARQRCKPNQERIHLLATLKSMGFALAAVSNAVRESVIEMLELTGLSSFIDIMVCGNDVSKGKPNPETYRLSTQRLGLRPDQCLAVEDGFLGVQAARAAGTKVLWIKNISEVKVDRILQVLENRHASLGAGGNKIEGIAEGLFHSER